MKRIQFILLALALCFTVSAKEFHVAKTGNDQNNGGLESPFLTIQKAADIARHGDVITAHEAVVECAAIGRPDEVLGEKMEVFVHTGNMVISTEEIIAYCAARLADYKVPDFVNFTATTLPRNANGKIVKKELRKRNLQRFRKD